MQRRSTAVQITTALKITLRRRNTRFMEYVFRRNNTQRRTHCIAEHPVHRKNKAAWTTAQRSAANIAAQTQLQRREHRSAEPLAAHTAIKGGNGGS
eukprot:1386144-Alexandrium_andersonii.AAC.1